MTPQESGLSMWLIVALVIVIWPIFFVALWAAIVMMMSLIGGWRRLAQVYRTIDTPTGKAIPYVTGMVGASRYKRLLTITTNERGMFIEIRWVFRLGHPSLFIPWRDIHNARKMNLFYWEFIAFDVGNPAIASMRLPSDVFVGTPVFINEGQKT
jgi:hypothetical protein